MHGERIAYPAGETTLQCQGNDSCCIANLLCQHDKLKRLTDYEFLTAPDKPEI